MSASDLASVDVHPVETYEYNWFNQLLSVTGPSGTTSFGYDGNGNQVSKTDGLGPTTYAYSYDNRLVGITSPTGSSAYEYDANGLRTKKADSTGTRSYLLDGLSVVAEYAPDASKLAWYTQSLARIDEVLSVVNSHGKYWYEADALGSTYAMTNGAGAVVSRSAYDVFGERSLAAGTEVRQPFGFTGREHDQGGLVYARARFLNPGTGSWTQVDPFNLGAWMASGQSSAAFTFGQRSGINRSSGSSLLGLTQRLNYYSLVVGNPVNEFDPSGESGLSACAADGLMTAAILLQARRFDSMSASLLAMIVRITRLAVQAAIPELLALVAAFVMLMEVADTTTTVLVPGRTVPPPGEKFRPDCITALKLLGDICRASPPARKPACWLQYAGFAFICLFRPDKW